MALRRDSRWSRSTRGWATPLSGTDASGRDHLDRPSESPLFGRLSIGAGMLRWKAKARFSWRTPSIEVPLEAIAQLDIDRHCNVSVISEKWQTLVLHVYDHATFFDELEAAGFELHRGVEGDERTIAVRPPREPQW